MKRAIFPLPIFILPGGYTRLRIFEPRYLTMVKNAIKQNSGFVLCSFSHDTAFNVAQNGCLVEIVDFDQDEHGQLLIDVFATQSVHISDPHYDEQKLRYANVSVVNYPDWYHSDIEITAEHQLLSQRLQTVFSQTPDLNSLYRNTEFTQLAWVVARWLELLPISIDKKQQLAYQSRFDNLLKFLHTVVSE